MNKKQKKVLTRIIIAAVLMIAFSFLTVEDYTAFVLFLIPYLVIGYDILIKAGKGIKNHQVFDENFLMAVATVGAIALGDYREGVAVMLFYQIGELFQSYAVGKSRRNISDLMDIRPDYANIERDGEIEEVDPDEVEIGSIIVVKPGEKVPIDGVIIEGTTTLNTSALTGESVPRDASEGDEVISGWGFSELRQRRNLVSRRFRRFWIWWRTQAQESPVQRTLFPSLPNIIHRLYAMVRWRWQCFRRLSGCFLWVFHRNGEIGSCER